jgi:hypothetical protein
MKTRALRIIALFPLAACTCGDNSGLGKLKTQIAVDPARIDFGDVPLGVTVKQTVTITSEGTGALTLKSATLMGPSMFSAPAVVTRKLPPMSTMPIDVSATPDMLGPRNATLVIMSDDPSSGTVKVPITLNAVPDPSCDDGNVCTADAFDQATNGCKHTFADGTPCAPADKCIADAVCSQGVCLGKPKVCDDHSACTRDLCNQSTGDCVFLPEQNPCDDNNPCTADSCDATGCHHDLLPSGTPCDDGDQCTSGDSCFAGECRGTGAPDGTTCDDGDSCTIGDTCHSGHCKGQSIIAAANEGDVVFTYHLTVWPAAFLHRREVSLSDDGVFFGLDHLPLTNPSGLAHLVFAMKQCGTDVYKWTYRPPDSHVLVTFVRREMQLSPDDTIRIVVGVRQLPQDGFEPQTTAYVLDAMGNVSSSQIEIEGGETGRSLLPDGSHIFGIIWPLSMGPPTDQMDSMQNLVIVREDRAGNVLWRHERTSTTEWAEYLGVAGPRVLFWASGKFGALDFNTGSTVWTADTDQITKEMALSTNLSLGVARADPDGHHGQLIGVEILHGQQNFVFPANADGTYVARTDPVISADGRVLVLMERNNPQDTTKAIGLDWVELAPDGTVMSTTQLPYVFPDDFGATQSEDDPYPTVADDGVSYIGYGDTFWAIDPGGHIRWSLTSTVPNAFTGTVPLLRDDGIMLISEGPRMVRGVRTNGGKMSATGWSSFRHDRRRTNFTP